MFCSNCGYSFLEEAERNENALPVFSTLHNNYIIGRVIGQGGFGITYAAKHISANKECCIKEFYPKEFAHRAADGYNVEPNDSSRSAEVYRKAKEGFVEEARSLVDIHGTKDIVCIYNFFNENNTSYIVMERLDGSSLAQRIRERKLPSLELSFMILLRCINALEKVHAKNILHRDISPGNIFLSRDEREVHIIDFGAARSFINSTGMTVLFTPDYAPPEAHTKVNQGPWRDVYSLAATVMHLISGRKPYPPQYKLQYIQQGGRIPTLSELNSAVSQSVSEVFERAISLDFKKRYQSMREFKEALRAVAHTQPQLKEAFDRLDEGEQYRPQPQPQPQKCGFIECHDRNQRLIYKKEIKAGESLVIGRSASAQLVDASSPAISKAHCSICFNASTESFTVTDLSQNGTFLLTGARLMRQKPYSFKHGSCIRPFGSIYYYRLCSR